MSNEKVDLTSGAALAARMIKCTNPIEYQALLVEYYELPPEAHADLIGYLVGAVRGCHEALSALSFKQ